MEQCQDCRYIRPPISQIAGHECIVMGKLFPVSFMRRHDGRCGPKGELFEKAHIPTGKKARHDD